MKVCGNEAAGVGLWYYYWGLFPGCVWGGGCLWLGGGVGGVVEEWGGAWGVVVVVGGCLCNGRGCR